MSDLIDRLATLQNADLVWPAPGGEGEYLFKHALTQETAYQTVLLRTRRDLHLQVAKAYEDLFADRLDSFAFALGRHYAEAGDRERAISYFRRAGEQAERVGSHVEALHSFRLAYQLAPDSDVTTRAKMGERIGAVLERQGDYTAATEWLNRALELARAADNTVVAAQSLIGLAGIESNRGAFDLAESQCLEGLQLAREAADRASEALGLRVLGIIADYQGEWANATRYCQESLAIYQSLDDRQGITNCLNSLGAIALNEEKLDQAGDFFRQALEVSREIGDRHASGIRLMNLGTLAAMQKDYSAARAYLTEALEIAREVGSAEDIATAIHNLGDVAGLEGDDATARQYHTEAARLSAEIGAIPLTLYALVSLAGIEARAGRMERAAELLGFVLGHPASNAELIKESQPTVSFVRDRLGAQESQAALARGRLQDLETVLGQVVSLRPMEE